MATDGPIPPPCDPEIFSKGETILIVGGISSNRMENWVKKVRETSGSRIDWHFAAGRAVVKVLGDWEAVRAAVVAMDEHKADLDQAMIEARVRPIPGEV